MKILELFSGTQGISKEFRKNNWETFTIDNNVYFNNITNMNKNILNVTSGEIVNQFGYPDVVWASPPCTTFSVASVRWHWDNSGEALKPKSDKALIGVKIIRKTLQLIEELNPKYWFIENPRGMLRKMPFMKDLPRYTVTYCQYGDDRMKPTDIWTNHPNPKFKPTCSNGDDCHASAPRGSQTGTQGRKSNIEKSKIPQKLCKHIAEISMKY